VWSSGTSENLDDADAVTTLDNDATATTPAAIRTFDPTGAPFVRTSGDRTDDRARRLA
jgi:hypothetical protein